jgi:hypothetical protein
MPLPAYFNAFNLMISCVCPAGCTHLAQAPVPPGSSTDSPAAAQHGSTAAATAAGPAAP